MDKKHFLYSKIVTSDETPKLVKWIVGTKIIKNEILAAYFLVFVAIVFTVLSIFITKNTLDRSQVSAVKYSASAIPDNANPEEKMIAEE